MRGPHAEVEGDDGQPGARERLIEVRVGRPVEVRPGAAMDVDEQMPRGRRDGAVAAGQQRDTLRLGEGAVLDDHVVRSRAASPAACWRLGPQPVKLEVGRRGEGPAAFGETAAVAFKVR
jgi:hypothetical protein